jgi:hypothetical protein
LSLLLLLLQAEAEHEPLALSGVDISNAAAQQLKTAWQAGRRSSLYPTAQHFLELVEQVSLSCFFNAACWFVESGVAAWAGAAHCISSMAGRQAQLAVPNSAALPRIGGTGEPEVHYQCCCLA